MFYTFWSRRGQCDVQFSDEDIFAQRRSDKAGYEIVESREEHLNCDVKFLGRNGV